MCSALKLRLEFRTTIGLKQIHMTTKSPPHTLVEELTAIFCRQRWRQENISFLTEDTNRGESKEFPKIDSVHLYYLPWLNGVGYRASFPISQRRPNVESPANDGISADTHLLVTTRYSPATITRMPVTMAGLTLSPIKATARTIAKRGDETKSEVALVAPMYFYGCVVEPPA